MRLKTATLVLSHLTVVAVAVVTTNHQIPRAPVSKSPTEKSTIRHVDRSNDIVEHLTFEDEICDADQIRAISVAVRRAQIQVSTANTYMQHFSRPEYWNQRMTDMFGAYNPERAQTAKEIIERMHRLDFSDLKCKCNNCVEDVAYTGRFAYPEITLCRPFFAPQMDRAGALIHEVSHFVEFGDTYDWAYTKDKSIELAKNRPELAVFNADNYNHFIAQFPPATDCTAPQVNEIDEAAKKADSLTTEAYQHFMYDDDDWTNHKAIWFGTQNNSRETIIRRNFKNLVERKFRKYKYICLPQCHPGEFGYTTPGGFPNVYLCPGFFETPIEQSKNNLAAGNLIEMVAAFERIANATLDLDVSGPRRTRRYARKHPDKAYLHADSYRQFIIHTQKEDEYCSDNQLEYLTEVAGIARKQMQNANQLARRDIYWPKKMKTWFGPRSYMATKPTLVRKNIQAIFEVNYDKISYICPTECDPLSYGYPNLDEDFDVVLCPKFFPMSNANVTPTRSAGALIEIVSQFKHVANANVMPEAHTAEECKKLAKDTMIDAVYNAASYRHFAHEFYTGGVDLEATEDATFQNDQLPMAFEDEN